MSGGSCYVRRDCSTLPQAAWRSKEIAHRHVRSCVDSLWLGCHIYNPSPPVPLSDFRTRCVRPVGKFAHLGSNAPLTIFNPSLRLIPPLDVLNVAMSIRSAGANHFYLIKQWIKSSHGLSRTHSGIPQIFLTRTFEQMNVLVLHCPSPGFVLVTELYSGSSRGLTNDTWSRLHLLVCCFLIF